ncbi:MAG: arsenate reductase [Boseongicola sp.]|nr:arsenate reductase [Boseongicola sp.]
MTLYGLKNCDTCRTAMKTLMSAGVEVVLHDVRAEPLPEDVLSGFHERFGEALVNKRSTTWRGLNEDERTKHPVTVLQKHPALMKRPVIRDGDRMTLGWDATVEAKYLG